MKDYIFYYLLGINILTFFIFGLDKLKAIYNKYRISENFLILLLLIGGVVGGALGMVVWRHKIKKIKFWFFIILIFAVAIYFGINGKDGITSLNMI